MFFQRTHLCNPDPRKRLLKALIMEAVHDDIQEATLGLASG